MSDVVGLRDAVVEQLASTLHDDWRASRLLPDGTYEPRVKATGDAAWVKRHGTDQVDIANSEYRDLPADWQAENKSSAQVAVDQIERAVAAGQPLDLAFVERASAVVHDKWLERNGEWAPPEQQLPYGQLSAEEQQKDRVMVQRAVAVYQNEVSTRTPQAASKGRPAFEDVSGL